jgi:hypothetical protein
VRRQDDLWRIEGREQVCATAIERLFGDGIAETVKNARQPLTGGALSACGGIDVDERPRERDGL